MLKKRIIPVLLSRNGSLVKGRRFQSDRVVGQVLQAARVHQARGVDELVVLDIAATTEGRGLDMPLLGSLTDGCMMPLAIGGGIRNVEDVAVALRSGADKVVIGTAAVTDPDLINRASEKFGAQAVVVAIDVRHGRVVAVNGRVDSGQRPLEFALECASRGAGEFIVTDVERDGTMEGYNIGLIREIAGAVGVPVVAAGGCADYADMETVLRTTEASGVAAGALFLFADATPAAAARFLAARGLEVRTPEVV